MSNSAPLLPIFPIEYLNSSNGLSGNFSIHSSKLEFNSVIIYVLTAKG